MEYNQDYLLNLGTEKERKSIINKYNLSKAFDNQARFLGDVGKESLYGICGITSTCTAKLYKMFIGLQLCAMKFIEYDEEKLFDVEEGE